MPQFSPAGTLTPDGEYDLQRIDSSRLSCGRGRCRG